jgi:tRNA G37 N-methylase TrmD
LRDDIVSIFPDYFAPLDLSLIGKARGTGILDLSVHDLRTWTSDVHRTVDDSPYGGGPGMVMRPEPWAAALAVIDAAVRLLPGAMSDQESAYGDSFWDRGLSAPSYTRPPEYRGFRVPDVLLSGDHGRIARWREEEGARLTRERSPSLDSVEPAE